MKPLTYAEDPFSAEDVVTCPACGGYDMYEEVSHCKCCKGWNKITRRELELWQEILNKRRDSEFEITLEDET